MICLLLIIGSIINRVNVLFYVGACDILPPPLKKEEEEYYLTLDKLSELGTILDELEENEKVELEKIKG